MDDLDEARAKVAIALAQRSLKQAAPPEPRPGRAALAVVVAKRRGPPQS